MKVSEIMNKPMAVGAEDRVDMAAEIMARNNLGSLVVEEGGKTVGIVTERDMLTKVVAKDRKASEMKISDIMTKEIIAVDKDATLAYTNMKMMMSHIRRMLIKDGDRIVGIVSMRDISSKMNEELGKEAKQDKGAAKKA